MKLDQSSSFLLGYTHTHYYHTPELMPTKVYVLTSRPNERTNELTNEHKSVREYCTATATVRAGDENM